MNKGIFLYPLIIVFLITAFICFIEQANAQSITNKNRLEASVGNVKDNFLVHRSRLLDRIKRTRKNTTPEGMVRSTSGKDHSAPTNDSQRPSSISKKRHFRDRIRIDPNNPNSYNGRRLPSGDERSRAQITDLNKELMEKGVSIAAADGITEAWVRQYSAEPWLTVDYATAIAVDASGNVYVTGCSDGSGSSYDYATIKYDTNGTEIWVGRYNGTGNGYDEATAIAVDASGNVYVTGWSDGSGTSADYVTIKYNENGNEQWIVRYNGSGNSDDMATAIAVDASGNVYVTGYCQGDYTTIKYSSTGTELWVAQDGTGNEDFPYAIAVDASGNVYVTGLCGFDYGTIKYNASSITQWFVLYNGPGNSYDDARAIAVDASGNVYVTGMSDGSGTYADYATIKYSTSGAQQWVARYNGPANSSDEAASIAVDVSGNVYVTGKSIGSGTSYDYATVKYNASGTEQWAARYNGPGNSSDYGCDIAIDASGNVYVTGTSSGSGTSDDVATIMYNASGTEQWVARYDGPGNYSDEGYAIAVDASGNVYVTGCSYDIVSTNYEYKTVKYNTTGVEQWAAPYNNPGNRYDCATAIAVDASGNVYVTGSSHRPGSAYDYATVKYSTTGTELWVARYNGPGNYGDEAIAIAVDASGNVYVTGNSYGTSSDYATIKYSASGTEQWVARYNGPLDSYEEVAAIAVDASGNVYVTGYSEYDYATIKYSPTGTELWVVFYNGPIDYDFATAIAVDASSNVYVTGYSYGYYTDYATIKYSTSGVEQWVARYNGPGYSYDEAKAIAVDISGNVYVTGKSIGSGTHDDYATIKYNASGIEQWAARYNGPGNNDDEATAIAVDVSGNVYVTGWSYDPSTNTDYTTIKYNASGTDQWVARYNGPGNSSDYGFGIAIDASGNVYVTGMSPGSGTDDDFATVKYNASGTEQWVARYNGPGNDIDEGAAIALDASGNVYVTGSSYGPDPGCDYTTIKYEQNLVSEIALGTGWNLVSVPRAQSDYSANLLFPAKTGDMYSYNSSTGTYDAAATLALGPGYWVNYASADIVTIAGDPPSSPTVTATQAGWILIGSREATVAVSSLILSDGAVINGDVYKYDPGLGTYVATTVIDPGVGAWMNVSKACTVTIP